MDKLDLIFDEWKASLKQKDRTREAVSGNFEELFHNLRVGGATFERAHVFLAPAIKAHQPPPALARITYKNAKHNPKLAALSEKEFVDQWNNDIADKGTNAFFDVFPRPKDPEELDEDPEPKVFGSMSAKEYKAQRRHADDYPVLDTAELERRMLSGSYNPEEDIAQILGNKDKDGESK